MSYLYWYCQSLGSVVGLIVCIYTYLRGDILLLTNISGNFDFLNLGQIIASYTLYPLCIITGLLGIYKSSKTKEKILSKKFDSLNTMVITLTIIIGFLGCSIFFTFPTIIFILPYIINKIIRKEEKINIDSNNNKINDNTLIANNKNTNPKLQQTKEEMAIELLKQEANIDFIIEITGLSHTDIEKLHKNIK